MFSTLRVVKLPTFPSTVLVNVVFVEMLLAVNAIVQRYCGEKNELMG